MEFTIFNYILFLVCLFSGCLMYLNTPSFCNVYLLGISHFLSNALGLFSGIIVAFIMGMVAVIANKVATKWWSERGVLLYEKWFGKKKKRK